VLRPLVFAFLAVSILPAQDKLPVKRVVLYKNGIGYFEHLGQVQGNQDVGISFTSGQLNDVLKSLTVLDLSGGRISGVAYGSSAPVDRQLDDLHLPLGEKSSLTDFLGALRGARLEIRNGAYVVNGRLLSVERKTRISGGTTLEVDYIALLTDSGEVKTTEVSPSFSVRLLDRGLPAKVERYLDLVSFAREADVRRMVISTQGSGERNLFVSYISEVPVWKSTYRIILNSKTGQKPMLQGWAIVDNTVGEDWEKVELSLVAGAPQSFIQNLSQPYYARRPVVALPDSANTAPQTYEATLIPGGSGIVGTVADGSGAVIPNAVVKAFTPGGELASQATTDANGKYELAPLPDGEYRLEADAPGFQRSIIQGLSAQAGKTVRYDITIPIGAATQTVTVTASPTIVQTSASTITKANLGSGRALGGRGFSGGGAYKVGSGGGIGGGMFVPPPPPVNAQELGDLFEYKLKEPVTILKNRSALVPIIQSTIAAEKVSVWNDQAGTARPQRALWLNNSSNLTLDGGSFSVLEEETFAGEGIFEPIRPGERRLVSYATDLALNASSRDSAESGRVTRVIINRGIMTHESSMREKKTYTFRNEDTSPRTVIVEHRVRTGYNLTGDAKPIESTAGWMRFRVPVDSKQTATLVVEESRPIATTYEISNLNSDQVALFVRQQSVDRTVEEALRKILAQKAAIAGLEEQSSTRDTQMEAIFDDQQRLRENMKSLKGTAEEKALTQRYTQQLNDQETRLETLRKEKEQLESKKEAAQTELNRMIQSLSLDVQL
jgi:hypothetical protein